MPSYFEKASKISMGPANFSRVGRNQINNYYGIQEEREHTIFDNYRDILLGDVKMVQDLGNVTIRCGGYQSPMKTVRTVSTAVLYPDQGSKYTILQYDGPDAEKEWMNDFLKAAQARSANRMQLLGINRSHVPLLIFHDELVPLGHVWDKLHPFGHQYFRLFASQKLGCQKEEIWIDSKQGTLIPGLEGPQCYNFHLFSTKIEVLSPSSSFEFLQNDSLWRYISELPLDREFDLAIVSFFNSLELSFDMVASMSLNFLFLSPWTGSTIAVGSVVWKCYEGAHSRMLMPDGATRFTLDNACNELFLASDEWNIMNAWISQASSVFHKCGISLDDSLQNYKIIVPDRWVNVWIDDNNICQQRRQKHGPIYLFILPWRSFWSFDENGKKHLSKRRCKYLGLPASLHPISIGPTEISLHTTAYKDIHRWQTLRGFDPKTTDFARYLGHPIIFDLVQPKRSQFVEVTDSDPEDLCLDLLFCETQEDKEPATSFWSLLTTPFSYEAVEGSDIPAVVM